MSLINVAKFALKAYRNYRIFNVIVGEESNRDELIVHEHNGYYYTRLGSDPTEQWYLHFEDGTAKKSQPPGNSRYAGSVYFFTDKKGQVFVANEKNQWEPA